MPDDKRGREKQARNADRRQRERAIAADLERMSETEPEIDEGELAFFETALEELSFPATGTEIVSEMGHRQLDAREDKYSVAELVPATDEETYGDPTAVRKQVQRPTVARAIKRVVEATESVQQTSLSGSQRETYEKTFQALKEINAVDEDEGIHVLTDWIVSELEEIGELPDSRTVRRRASEYAREQGYDVRNDEWLGV